MCASLAAFGEGLCFQIQKAFKTDIRIYIYPPAEKGKNSKGPLENYNAVFGAGLAVTAPCQQVDEQHK
jgi:hypothetical protein